jgi:hypothetical protein
MIDIFISYAHPDRSAAERIATFLRDQAWDVFWDRTIEPGAEWNQYIQLALRDARCVLVLWSANSRSSFWVRGEAADAYERNVYLPVSIDGTSRPKLFAHVQTESIE